MIARIKSHYARKAHIKTLERKIVQTERLAAELAVIYKSAIRAGDTRKQGYIAERLRLARTKCMEMQRERIG